MLLESLQMGYSDNDYVTAKPVNKGMSEWMRNYWRPLMAIQYLLVCLFDFIIAPVLWPILQSHFHMTLSQWVPTTLGSGGLYHLAMGAVLGVAAWTRSMEKNDEMMRGSYERGAYDHASGYYHPQNTMRASSQGEPEGKKPLPGME
jgi:hypothetical protein